MITNDWTDGWMERSMVGWKTAWMDGWMDGGVRWVYLSPLMDTLGLQPWSFWHLSED